jgi:hypothetical protein
MSAIILNFLRPYLFQIALYGVIAVVATGALVGAKIHYQNVGYQNAINAIAAQDKEAIDAADQARGRVDACRASGGVWSQSDGLCARR